VTVLTTAAAAAVVLSANAANAAPSEKPNKDEVKTKVDKLYQEAEQATEKLDGAKDKQQKLQKEISALQDNVARGQEELNELRDGLGSMASAQYRTGGIDPSVALFLSSNPDDFLDKQRSLAQQRAEASAKLKDLAHTRAELAKKKKEVQSKLGSAQKLLNSLTAQEKAALASQEQERATRASERVDLGTTKAASGRAGAAFAAAQSVIGAPYVYTHAGPSSFDCSGLTSWAYAQAGVTIPRTSEAQANAGTRIYSQSDLQVGDLVIFYGDQHHVGLYAGNGQVLHAPHTGAVVRYESIANMPFQFGVRI
jgi:cell wall-associated NlpC family hydrolase